MQTCVLQVFVNYDSEASRHQLHDVTLSLVTTSPSPTVVTLTVPYTSQALMYTMIVKPGVTPPGYTVPSDDDETSSSSESAQGPLEDDERSEEEGEGEEGEAEEEEKRAIIKDEEEDTREGDEGIKAQAETSAYEDQIDPNRSQDDRTDIEEIKIGASQDRAAGNHGNKQCASGSTYWLQVALGLLVVLGCRRSEAAGRMEL